MRCWASAICPWWAKSLAKAKRLIRQGLEQGAVGFTTGSKYYPGPWADTRELIELCKVVREEGKVYMSEPRTTERAFGGGGAVEAMEIVRQSGVKLHFAHYRTSADTAGHIEKIMAPVDSGRRGGEDVTFDIYPYPSGSSVPVSFLPGPIQEDGPAAILSRLAHAEARKEIGAWLDAHQSLYLRPMTFSYVAGRPELEGIRLIDLAQERGRSPGETLCEVLVEQRLRVGHVTAPPESEDMQHQIAQDCIDLLTRPDYMVCSDITPAGGCTHPRCYGSFPRLLGRLRREFRTVSLEGMVHRMTDRPAQRFGLTRRGRIETDTSPTSSSSTRRPSTIRRPMPIRAASRRAFPMWSSMGNRRRQRTLHRRLCGAGGALSGPFAFGTLRPTQSRRRPAANPKCQACLIYRFRWPARVARQARSRL